MHIYIYVCVCYGAGVMQGLVPPFALAIASRNSCSSTSIWKAWSPMVTLNTVRAGFVTGRACVSSSVSTVASILIIVFLSYVCVCVAVVYLFSFKRGCLLVPLQELR